MAFQKYVNKFIASELFDCNDVAPSGHFSFQRYFSSLKPTCVIVGDKIAEARSGSLVALEFLSLEYVELYVHAICTHLYRDV